MVRETKPALTGKLIPQDKIYWTQIFKRVNGTLLKKYGSVGEASCELNITKTTILNQCNHKVKTKPRCGYWFRYLKEYESNGFVL